ncbi:DUF1648 domain-containing protein [Larkinella punicea]|uniref:DUF1648 domain-containing protein n=1 Tax=Larkinella punicea TaxID=2315727 RepID=A0A368JES7_9BACT|nr:DUF1648 domain-containing protein [Larkinella punicea]RCR66179.1 DUF1648 domain-containing protein [Larkinella punicea]
MKPLLSTAVPRTERLLNALTLLLLVGQVVLIIGYYAQLPETIPVHFGLAGKPDRWGGRGQLFIVPGLATFIFVIFWSIRQIPPDYYNMPTPLTPENRERQIRNTHEMLAMLACVVMIFMFWSLWDWIRSASNGELVRSKIAPLIFIGLSILGTIIYYVRRAYTLK